MTKYKINVGFITQKIGDKTTIFSGERSILFTLNETAAYMFNGLKLGWEKKKIINGLMDRYEISKDEAKEDLEKFTQKLLKKRIIVISND